MILDKSVPMNSRLKINNSVNTTSWKRQSHHPVKLSCIMAISMLTLGLTLEVLADGSCFEYFENLPPGSSGSCADIAFFGFTGEKTEDFACAGTGPSSAAIDLFDEFDLLPDFFKPEAPVSASVEVQTSGDDSGLKEFSIIHKGRVGIFPFSEMPAADISNTTRFIASGSESKVAFQTNKPDGVGEVPIEIELTQDFSMQDPIDSSLGEIGTFFLFDIEDVDSGEILDELVGSSKFDSALDPEPDFDDEFAPGYAGFTETTTPEPGVADVEFNRTISLEIELETDLSITTLQSESIFTDGFESGDISFWSSQSDKTFVFRVSSPDPLVRFILNLEFGSGLIQPDLDITLLSETQVQLSWEALETQIYTILTTTDILLPLDQWQAVGTVEETAGTVTRELTTTGEHGFFVLRVTK